MTDKIVILTTVDTEDLALKIASGLVEERLAACVNLISPVRSIYRWKEKVCDDREMILMIKTSAHLFNDVRDWIRQHHTYELPEILALPVAAGEEKALDWIGASVRPKRT